MLMPLYGFLEGDTLGLVVLVQSGDPVRTIADSMRRAAGMRVAAGEHLQVYFKDQALDPATSVAAAGLAALDRVDVRSAPT